MRHGCASGVALLPGSCARQDWRTAEWWAGGISQGDFGVGVIVVPIYDHARRPSGKLRMMEADRRI